MSVAIPAEYEQFVQHEVASGNYQSAESVIAEALQLLRERKLELLRKEIEVGIQAIERGDVIEINDEQELRAFFEDIMARGRERLNAEQGHPGQPN